MRGLSFFILTILMPAVLAGHNSTCWYSNHARDLDPRTWLESWATGACEQASRARFVALSLNVFKCGLSVPDADELVMDLCHLATFSIRISTTNRVVMIQPVPRHDSVSIEPLRDTEIISTSKRLLMDIEEDLKRHCGFETVEFKNVEKGLGRLREPVECTDTGAQTPSPVPAPAAMPQSQPQRRETKAPTLAPSLPLPLPLPQAHTTAPVLSVSAAASTHVSAALALALALALLGG